MRISIGDGAALQRAAALITAFLDDGPLRRWLVRTWRHAGSRFCRRLGALIGNRRPSDALPVAMVSRPGVLLARVDGAAFRDRCCAGCWSRCSIAALSTVITLAAGLLTALLRMSPSWAARGLATLYLEVVRNTPILVQIYMFYFVLAPLIGLDRFAVGVLEPVVLRGDAGRRGHSRQHPGGAARPVGSGARHRACAGTRCCALIVLPQALPLMLPPLTGVLINLVKNSAIVSVIAIADLATEARNLISDTLMSFEIWLTVAAVYLVDHAAPVGRGAVAGTSPAPPRHRHPPT